MTATIYEDKLSDGSKVTELYVTDETQKGQLIFHCISKAHAESLKLALKQHTVDFT